MNLRKYRLPAALLLIAATGGALAQEAAQLDEFLKKAKLDGYQSAQPPGHWVWDN